MRSSSKSSSLFFNLSPISSKNPSSSSTSSPSSFISNRANAA